MSTNIFLNSSISAPELVCPSGPGFSCCLLNDSSIELMTWNFQNFRQIKVGDTYGNWVHVNIQGEKRCRRIDFLHMMLQKPKVIGKDLTQSEPRFASLRWDRILFSRLYEINEYLLLLTSSLGHTSSDRLRHSLYLNLFIVRYNADRQIRMPI